jgi:hypothetical protein
MRANGGVTSATIPSSIAPGKYIIRNEIIALHRANLKEPEFYGQCGNIEVTGSGTDKLANSGVVASKLYSTSDNIFGYDIYDSRDTTWAIPGPALYAGSSNNAPVQSPTSQPAPTQPAQTQPAQNQPGDDDDDNDDDDNDDGEDDEATETEPAQVQPTPTPAPTTMATRTRTRTHKHRPTGCGYN